MKKSKILIIIGIIVISFLIYNIGLRNIINTFSQFQPLFILIIVPVFLLQYILAGLNTWIIVQPYRRIALSKIIKYNIFTLFYSSFMPGKLADLLIIFYLKRNNISTNKAMTVLFYDKSISLILKAILGTIGAVFILNQITTKTLGIPLIMALIVILVFFLITSKKFIQFIKQQFYNRFVNNISKFAKDVRSYKKNHKKNLILNGFVTILKTGFEGGLFYLLFISFGADTNLISVLIIYSLLSIINTIMLPIGISGLGLRETLGVITYQLINIDSAIVFNAYLIRLIILYGTNFLTFVKFSSELNLIKKQMLIKFVKDKIKK